MIRAAESSPIVAPVLRSLVGMNHGVAWPSTFNGHDDRIQGKFAADRIVGRPPDNFPRKQIHDYRQIKPALPRPNVRKICDTGLVSRRKREITLQYIRYQQLRRLRPRRTPSSITVKRLNLVDTHQARRGACRKSLQPHEDPGRRVGSQALGWLPVSCHSQSGVD